MAGECIKELSQSGRTLGFSALLCLAERKRVGLNGLSFSPALLSLTVLSLMASRHQVPSSGPTSPLAQMPAEKTHKSRAGQLGEDGRGHTPCEWTGQITSRKYIL